MSRGSKDAPLTALLLANGLLLDKRSFIGYRKEDITPHLWLRGIDMSNQRDRVQARDKNRCQKCGTWCSESGEAHHIIHRGNGGSDDISNLQWICSSCHRMKH